MSEQEVNEAAAMYWEHGTGSQIECDGKGQPTGFVRVPCVLHDAVTTVADAYLAEHPADSEQSVTEEWLRSVGFVAGRMPKDLALPPIVRGISLAGDEYWLVRTYPIPSDHEPKTRGHVRRLCSALGIPLKESP